MNIIHLNHLSVITCRWHRCRLKVPFAKSIEKDGLRFCSVACSEAFAKDEAEYNRQHAVSHKIPVLHTMHRPRPVEIDFNHFGADYPHHD